MMNKTEANRTAKLFESNQTMESLRVTVISALSLIDFLHSHGISYILTTSLKQDPLEIIEFTLCCFWALLTSGYFVFCRRFFFRFVRSFEGDEGHPTITNFSQLFRLLSLFTPVKLAVKGHCERDDDRVLLSTDESLGANRREAFIQKDTKRADLEATDIYTI